MPMYDFKCNSCDSEFEKLIRKEEDKVCKVCESKDILKKETSKSNFVLTGIGVYKNNTY